MTTRRHPITHAIRAERRKEADKRHATYASLSRKEKIALCDERRGNSTRERLRLEKSQ